MLYSKFKHLLCMTTIHIALNVQELSVFVAIFFLSSDAPPFFVSHIPLMIEFEFKNCISIFVKFKKGGDCSYTIFDQMYQIAVGFVDQPSLLQDPQLQ